MSRLKSAPAASRPAARSAPAGNRGVYVQSPKSDIYVVMIAISLGAILIGCILLALVMNRYDFQVKPTARLAPSGGSATALATNLENSAEFSSVRL